MKKIYNRTKNFIEDNMLKLKILFVSSVLIFVIYEVGRIFKDVDWAKVGQGLSNRSPLDILIMLVGGLIAVTPMLNYDFSIVKFLPGKFSKGYIIRSGWTTNSFTNIAGFGGLLGASLRAHFYSKNASKKQILYAISKIALFLVAGLSILCWIALIMMYGFGIASIFKHYFIWLVGGALYFPIVFIVTKFKNNKFFSDLTLGLELRLVLGSFFEWGFVALFFILIGLVMRVDTDYASIFPLYVIASVLGVVSMVPGGLGSFDVFMLMGMSDLGIATDQAVVWCLFFRIFYYIIPFIIGAVFFAHDMGSQVNEYFDDLPKIFFQKIAHALVTIFMYFSGIFLLLEAAVPNFTFSNSFLLKVYPYTFFFIHQTTDFIFAVVLITLGRAIQCKVKRAFWPALIVLIAGVINTLWLAPSLPLEIFLGLVIISIILARKELYREQLRYSINHMIADGLIFCVTIVVYLIVGLINTPNFTRHHRIPSVLLFPGQKMWLAGFLSLLIAGVLAALLLHFLSHAADPFRKQHYDEKRIGALIEKFGGNEVSQLAYLKDKNFYFYQADGEDQLFYMYRCDADKIIIMGEPVGNLDYLRESLIDFIKEADRFGYGLVFYETSQQVVMDLHDYGFDFMKTGEEGYVDLDNFTLSGKKRRPQRNLLHKYEREGYKFEIIEPPLSQECLAELRQVSDEWLDGESEKGFSLGFFADDYLQRAPVAVIKDENGKIVAFANLMPMAPGVLSIDLMRHLKTAPSGVMDVLFVDLFKYGQENGYHKFDLGMAPLSNVGSSEFSFFEEKVAHFIYEYGYRIYSFQGLRSYKNKYVNKWYPKYIAFRKRSSLITTMLQLVKVVNKKRVSPEDRNIPVFVPRWLR